MLYEKPTIVDFGSITQHTFSGNRNGPSPVNDHDDEDDDGDD